MHGVAHPLVPRHVQQHAKITAMMNGSRQTPATTAMAMPAAAGVAWSVFSSSMRPVMVEDGAAQPCSMHTEVCNPVLPERGSHEQSQPNDSMRTRQQGALQCVRDMRSALRAQGSNHLLTSQNGCVCVVCKLVNLARASCLDRLWGLALRALQQLLLNPLITKLWVCRLQARDLVAGKQILADASCAK